MSLVSQPLCGDNNELAELLLWDPKKSNLPSKLKKFKILFLTKLKCKIIGLRPKEI